MARYAFDEPMPAVQQVTKESGWKALGFMALAAAGIGFAGYVLLAPYQKMKSALATRSAELGAQRSAADEASTERDRLKAAVDKYSAADSERAAAETKRKGEVDAVATQLSSLKSVLDELGAAVVSGPTGLQVTFQVAKMVDRNGIDVSEGGAAALQIVAGAVKKAGARVRIKVHASTFPPPKELKSLFRTAGEMHAVRAARVMSALENAGLSPEQVSIVGVAAGPGDKPPPSRGRGKKGAPPPSRERLEIEVEPG
jgi:flagellar motor protein MotB